MIRSCAFSLRIPLDLMDKLVNAIKEEKFDSISEAMRSYIELGMHIQSYQPKIKDPEFLKSIEELKKTDGVIRWINTLTDVQIDAIATALQMEKNNRYEKKNSS